MKRKKKLFRDVSSDKAAFFLFAVGLMIIFWVFSLPGCTSTMPPIDVSFWAGDSSTDGIVRSQESKHIACSEPVMDDMVCESYADLKKVFTLLQQCKQWSASSTLVNTSDQLKRLAKKNPEVADALKRSSRR